MDIFSPCCWDVGSQSDWPQHKQGGFLSYLAFLVSVCKTALNICLSFLFLSFYYFFPPISFQVFPSPDSIVLFSKATPFFCYSFNLFPLPSFLFTHLCILAHLLVPFPNLKKEIKQDRNTMTTLWFLSNGSPLSNHHHKWLMFNGGVLSLNSVRQKTA